MPVQLIFPEIIQAYLQGKQIRMREEEFQKEQEFKQQQATEQQRQFSEEMAHRQEQFGAEQKFREASFGLTKQQAALQFRDAIAKGLLPGTPVEGTEELQADIPGLGPITAPSPKAYAETQAQLGAPTRQAETEAAIKRAVQSFIQTVPGRKEIEQQKGEIDAILQGKQDEADYKRAIDVANITGRYRLSASKIAREHEVDPDTLAGTAEMVEIGDLPMPAGKFGQAVLGLMIQQKTIPVPPKIAQAFRSDVAKVNVIISQMDDLLEANKRSFGGGVAKVRGAVEKQIGITELGDSLNRLNAQMGTTAPMFGGESGARLSDKDRERMDKLELNLGVSYLINKANLVEMKDLFNKTVNIKFGNLGDSQKKRLFDTTGVSWIKPISSDKTLLKINMEDGTSQRVPNTPENREKYKKYLKEQ